MATIQISKKTQERLIEVASHLQLERKRKVSFDEAIQYLIRRVRGEGKKTKRFLSFYGCLREKDVDKAHEELKALRAEEERKIERIARRFSA